MNVSSFIGLLPAAMIALATFIGFIFFTRCALGYRRSIERRLATHRFVPYRTAETSLEDVLAFLEDIGKMALCGMTAIGTLAVGMFATWFAWHATLIDHHASATDARFAHLEARLLQAEGRAEEAQREQRSLTAQLADAKKKDCMLRLNLKQSFPGEAAVRILDVFDGAISVEGDRATRGDEAYFPGTVFTEHRIGNNGLIMVRIPVGAKLALAVDPQAKATVAATCDGSKWTALLQDGHAVGEEIPYYREAGTFDNPRFVTFRPLSAPSATWPRGFVVSGP